MSFLDELNKLSQNRRNAAGFPAELSPEEREAIEQQAAEDFDELINRLIEYCKQRCVENAGVRRFAKITSTEFLYCFDSGKTDAVGEGWEEWWSRVKDRVCCYVEHRDYYGFSRDDRWHVRKAVKSYFEEEGLTVSFGERKWEIVRAGGGRYGEPEKWGEIYELTIFLTWQ